jgi:hypothetical protein
MADNDDATASLGDTEVLSVKNPPGHAIPELDKFRDDDLKIAFLFHFPLVSSQFHTVGRRFRG